MSFLTPLYLLGVLAVTLPVVLHMIRRTPRGRQEFSSVMFLEPSPPRITNRSTVEHWLLLVLRAVAVCLLALALARPFLRLSDARTVSPRDFRKMVLLLDTSASMRRAGVWPEAVERTRQLVAALGPSDRLELLGFDRQPRVLMDREQWQTLVPSARIETVSRLLEDLTPTWASTDLGRALIESAERLDEAEENDVPGVSRTIVVVSDLQEGCHLESLQTFQWPPQIVVRFETVGRDLSPNNAAVHPIHRTVDGSSTGDARVRVTNATGADQTEFLLRWSPHTSPDGETFAVSVPAGQSRVLSVGAPAESSAASHLVLEGDDHAFDNECFVSGLERRRLHVVLLSQERADDPEGMRYYLERALAETPERTVEIQVGGPDSERLDGKDIALVVVTSSPSAERMEPLRQYVAAGGTAFVVPARPDDLRAVFALLPSPARDVDHVFVEATVDDYVMLTDMDFTHPLFAALNQPPFSDFTKVRFWRHRQLPAELLPELRVLARFDDGAIAAAETAVGEGRVVLLTSGWHPADSQLSLSTKFVPMINGLLDDAAGVAGRQPGFVVGDEVDLSQLLREPDSAESVITPAGEEISIGDESPHFFKTDLPGRYRVSTREAASDLPLEFVVNLSPSESLTAPLTIDALRAVGLPMDVDQEPSSTSAELERQLLNSELEQQQRGWRWLIHVTILILMIETVVASRLARASRPA